MFEELRIPSPGLKKKIEKEGRKKWIQF